MRKSVLEQWIRQLNKIKIDELPNVSSPQSVRTLGEKLEHFEISVKFAKTRRAAPLQPITFEFGRENILASNPIH